MSVDGKAVLLALSLLAAREGHALEPYVIENSLAECVRLDPGTPFIKQNLLLYPVNIALSQPIGYCGCRSALASYQVGNGKTIIRQESLHLKTDRQALLILKADADLPFRTEQAVTLWLGCAGEAL